MLGHSFGTPGLMSGAIIGGIVGVALAALAQRLRYIESTNYLHTVIVGILGFAGAALIATNNLHTPVIPILSEGLVGLGAVLGSLAVSKGIFKRKGA